jgi:hypothetical protein
MPNIETILRDHTTLKVECVDRVYLNAYVPGLQRPNQLAYFLNVHRGKPLPSPALLGQMTDRFLASIKAFAERHQIPIVKFERGERKDDVAKKHLARFRRKEGVVFIGVAQEFDKAFRSKPLRRKDGTIASFDFYRASVPVNQYYFYILDPDWGPFFIKFSSYVPFGARLCINGHEWAKQQLRKRGIAYEALDNGFLSCTDPTQLQAICDHLSADDVDRLFRRWLARLPHPLSREDRAAGYRYVLSIWQFEFSLTHVFDRPVQGRHFFEEVIRDNLDLGRPDRIQLLFGRRVIRSTPSSFRTRVVHRGVMPKLSVEYKHSRVKQYFKENHALRTETVINNTYDVGIRSSLHNLASLKSVARNVNRRLLAIERVGHNCILTTRTFESFVLPSVADGQHVPGLRYGDPRVMALLAGLSSFLSVHDGFTPARVLPRPANQSLRGYVGALFDPGPKGYTRSRMTYDLRRLRLKGLLHRLPKKNRYVLTSLGRRLALFFTKTYVRILGPGSTRLDPTMALDPSDDLAMSFHRFEQALDQLISEAKIAA